MVAPQIFAVLLHSGKGLEGYEVRRLEVLKQLKIENYFFIS